MGEKIDKDGVIHEKGWDGEYRSKEGSFGPQKDTNIFGRPNVERDLLGNPKVKKNWWGSPIRSKSGSILFRGKDSSKSSSSNDELLVGLILFILGFIFILLWKVIKLIFICTKKGINALSAGEYSQAAKYLSVPIGTILIIVFGNIYIQKASSITAGGNNQAYIVDQTAVLTNNTSLINRENLNNSNPTPIGSKEIIPYSGSVIVNVSSVYLRAGPGDDYGIAGQARLGDTFTCYGITEDGTWIQIDISGTSWVAASNVNFSNEIVNVIIQPTADTKKVNTPTSVYIAPVLIDDSSVLLGKIVFTCQVYRDQTRNQICIINADGTGFRQLTDESSNFYASMSPDGRSVIFVSYRTKHWEIYEIDLSSGIAKQITSGNAEWYGPEISPDGRSIVATHDVNTKLTIWVMARDGTSQRSLVEMDTDCLDPTWSNDGKKILFACGLSTSRQLYIVDSNGGNLSKITDLTEIRGRSDWAVDGKAIATYIGPSWEREIVMVDMNGAIIKYLTKGGNNLAPSFSPGGSWIAFTSYMDNYGDDNGCEIYIMRNDGTGVKRLTNNNYCDYQPRCGQ
jgi:TolB protein